MKREEKGNCFDDRTLQCARSSAFINFLHSFVLISKTLLYVSPDLQTTVKSYKRKLNLQKMSTNFIRILHIFVLRVSP